MKIMVCYDGSDASRSALKTAKKHAEVFGARIFLVASLEKVTDNEQELIQKIEADLNDIKEKLTEEGLPCETFLLVRGLTPAEDLVAYAREQGIDEIVIGIRRKSKVGKLVFGSTAQYIILKAPCPVLTVK